MEGPTYKGVDERDGKHVHPVDVLAVVADLDNYTLHDLTQLKHIRRVAADRIIPTHVGARVLSPSDAACVSRCILAIGVREELVVHVIMMSHIKPTCHTHDNQRTQF